MATNVTRPPPHNLCLCSDTHLSLSRSHILFHSFFLSFLLVQTQSPVLQNKMLVPIAAVRAGSTPPQPSISLGAPPLPVQNGPAAGNKVRTQSSCFSDRCFVCAEILMWCSVFVFKTKISQTKRCKSNKLKSSRNKRSSIHPM